MNTSSIICTAALVVAFSAAPSCAQEQSVSLSLEQALELSGRNSPELRIARSRLRAALGMLVRDVRFPTPRPL